MGQSLEVATKGGGFALAIPGCWVPVFWACERVAGAERNHTKLPKLPLSSIPRPILSQGQLRAKDIPGENAVSLAGS